MFSQRPLWYHLPASVALAAAGPRNLVVKTEIDQPHLSHSARSLNYSRLALTSKIKPWIWIFMYDLAFLSSRFRLKGSLSKPTGDLNPGGRARKKGYFVAHLLSFVMTSPTSTIISPLTYHHLDGDTTSSSHAPLPPISVLPMYTRDLRGLINVYK